MSWGLVLPSDKFQVKVFDRIAFIQFGVTICRLCCLWISKSCVMNLHIVRAPADMHKLVQCDNLNTGLAEIQWDTLNFVLTQDAANASLSQCMALPCHVQNRSLRMICRLRVS